MAGRFTTALVHFLNEVFEFIRDVIAFMLKTVWEWTLMLAFLVVVLAIWTGFYFLLHLFLPPFAAVVGAVFVVWAMWRVIMQKGE